MAFRLTKVQVSHNFCSLHFASDMVLSCRSKSVDESYQISIVLFSSFWRLTEYIFWEIIVILDNVLTNARKYHIQSILPFGLSP